VANPLPSSSLSPLSFPLRVCFFLPSFPFHWQVWISIWRRRRHTGLAGSMEKGWRIM
jgi:hypothetical protein